MLATTNDPASAVATMPSGKMLTSFGYAIFGSPLRWVVMLAPLAAVFFLSFRIQSMSVRARRPRSGSMPAWWACRCRRSSWSTPRPASSQTFFATAAAFGALSLFGYTTKRDLTAMGSFLIMGVFGIIIAIPDQHLPAVVGAVLRRLGDRRAGLLGPHRLRHAEDQGDVFRGDDGSDVAGRKAIMGALTLYLDFINLFMFLLQFMGNRR
jgi:FtsH-binding integral membrane protein